MSKPIGYTGYTLLNNLTRSQIKHISHIYKTTDLDIDDISERFGLSLRASRKLCCKIVKQLPKQSPPKRRITHDLYTPDELALYRAFHSSEVDAFDPRRLDYFAVCNL